MHGSTIAATLALTLAAGASAQTPVADAPAEAQAEAAPVIEAPARPFQLNIGADIVSAYFFRGIRIEDSGFMFQPYADIAFDLFSNDTASMNLKVGTWHSFHSQATLTGTDDTFRKYWYETDFFVSSDISVGRFTFTPLFVVYTSPSDAFKSLPEIDLTVAYDDSDHFGKWALNPSMTLGIELNDNATDGRDAGVSLELGIAPGCTPESGFFKDVSFSFPVSVGLSLHDYYQDSSGEDDTFGYASVGVGASVPLHEGNGGSWTLTTGVDVLFLGDNAASFNDDDDVDVVARVGVCWSY